MASTVHNPLAQPITFALSGKTIPNRIYRSPLSEYASTYDESDIENTGKPLPKYVNLYKNLAEGGAGLICFGNIPIYREFLENKGNAILDPSNPWDLVEAFRPAIQAAKSKGAIVLPQLQSPGRQVPAFINSAPRSSSNVQLKPSLNKIYSVPTPLSKAEIKSLISRYVWASKVLAEVGADGIILHGCHGYIITQFLSPLINKRTDEYGGSLKNRARFVLEIITAIKDIMPSDKFIIAVKFNCHDFIEGGTAFEDTCIVLKWLEDAGVDFFDISGGTYESPAWRGNVMKELVDRPMMRERGSYFIEWAQELKKVLSRAVIGTTGGWRSSQKMAEAVHRGDIDMCGLGTPLMMEPGLVKKILGNEEWKGKSKL